MSFSSMSPEQLRVVPLYDLTRQIYSWCENMDPGHELNKLTGKSLASELSRRMRYEGEWIDGLASDERASGRESIAEALETLVSWACGF